MSVGAIPFTAIAEYFRVFDICGEFEEFVYIIRRMDHTFLELNAADLEKDSKKGS